VHLECLDQHVYRDDLAVRGNYQQYLVRLSVRLYLVVFVLHWNAHAVLVLRQLDDVQR